MGRTANKGRGIGGKKSKKERGMACWWGGGGGSVTRVIGPSASCRYWNCDNISLFPMTSCEGNYYFSYLCSFLHVQKILCFIFVNHACTYNRNPASTGPEECRMFENTGLFYGSICCIYWKKWLRSQSFNERKLNTKWKTYVLYFTNVNIKDL